MEQLCTQETMSGSPTDVKPTLEPLSLPQECASCTQTWQTNEVGDLKAGVSYVHPTEMSQQGLPNAHALPSIMVRPPVPINNATCGSTNDIRQALGRVYHSSLENKLVTLTTLSTKGGEEELKSYLHKTLDGSPGAAAAAASPTDSTTTTTHVNGVTSTIPMLGNDNAFFALHYQYTETLAQHSHPETPARNDRATDTTDQTKHRRSARLRGKQLHLANVVDTSAAADGTGEDKRNNSSNSSPNCFDWTLKPVVMTESIKSETDASSNHNVASMDAQCDIGECDIVVGFMVRKGTGGTAAARVWSASHTDAMSTRKEPVGISIEQVNISNESVNFANDPVSTNETVTMTDSDSLFRCSSEKNTFDTPHSSIEQHVHSVTSAFSSSDLIRQGEEHGATNEGDRQQELKENVSTTSAVAAANAKFIKFTFSVRMELYIRQELWNRLSAIPGRQMELAMLVNVIELHVCRLVQAQNELARSEMLLGITNGYINNNNNNNSNSNTIIINNDNNLKHPLYLIKTRDCFTHNLMAIRSCAARTCPMAVCARHSHPNMRPIQKDDSEIIRALTDTDTISADANEATTTTACLANNNSNNNNNNNYNNNNNHNAGVSRQANEWTCVVGTGEAAAAAADTNARAPNAIPITNTNMVHDVAACVEGNTSKSTIDDVDTTDENFTEQKWKYRDMNDIYVNAAEVITPSTTEPSHPNQKQPKYEPGRKLARNANKDSNTATDSNAMNATVVLIEWFFNPSEEIPQQFDTCTYPRDEDMGLYPTGVHTYCNVFSMKDIVKAERNTEKMMQDSLAQKFRPMTAHHAERAGRVTRTKLFFNARYLWTRDQLACPDAGVANGIRTDVSRSPSWVKRDVEDPLVHAGVLEEGFTNSHACNIYHDGSEGLGQHFDDLGRFAQPVVTLRLFSDSRLSFGCKGYGFSNGEFTVPMPRGSITVMTAGSYAATVVKHCIRPCDMTLRSGVLLFRQIHPHLIEAATQLEESRAMTSLEAMTLEPGPWRVSQRWQPDDVVNTVCVKVLNSIVSKVVRSCGTARGSAKGLRGTGGESRRDRKERSVCRKVLHEIVKQVSLNDFRERKVRVCMDDMLNKLTKQHEREQAKIDRRLLKRLLAHASMFYRDNSAAYAGAQVVHGCVPAGVILKQRRKYEPKTSNTAFNTSIPSSTTISHKPLKVAQESCNQPVVLIDERQDQSKSEVYMCVNDMVRKVERNISDEEAKSKRRYKKTLLRRAGNRVRRFGDVLVFGCCPMHVKRIRKAPMPAVAPGLGLAAWYQPIRKQKHQLQVEQQVIQPKDKSKRRKLQQQQQQQTERYHDRIQQRAHNNNNNIFEQQQRYRSTAIQHDPTPSQPSVENHHHGVEQPGVPVPDVGFCVDTNNIAERRMLVSSAFHENPIYMPQPQLALKGMDMFVAVSHTNVQPEQCDLYNSNNCNYHNNDNSSYNICNNNIIYSGNNNNNNVFNHMHNDNVDMLNDNSSNNSNNYNDNSKKKKKKNNNNNNSNNNMINNNMINNNSNSNSDSHNMINNNIISNSSNNNNNTFSDNKNNTMFNTAYARPIYSSLATDQPVVGDYPEAFSSALLAPQPHRHPLLQSAQFGLQSEYGLSMHRSPIASFQSQQQQQQQQQQHHDQQQTIASLTESSLKKRIAEQRLSFKQIKRRRNEIELPEKAVDMYYVSESRYIVDPPILREHLERQ